MERLVGLIAVLACCPGAVFAASTLHMTEPRAIHTATALADGRVLIVGGFLHNGALLDSAELFDPRTGRFAPVGSMPTPRMGHTATLLRSGQVLIAGGRGGELRDQSAITASALLFDPVTQTFAPAGQMTTPRTDHTATLLLDGRVLLAGGDARGEEATASAEVYDPAARSFTAVSRMGKPRSYHAAALLPDGRVLVVGGGPDLATVLASAEVFDPVGRAFVEVAPMATARRKLAAVPLRDGRVLIAGGSSVGDYAGKLCSVEIFDPATARFTPGPPMHTARFKVAGAAATVPSGAIIAGGAPGAELFDVRAGAFRPLAGGAPDSRYYATVTVLPSGAVLIAGGYGGHGAADDAAYVVALP